MLGLLPLIPLQSSSTPKKCETPKPTLVNPEHPDARLLVLEAAGKQINAFCNHGLELYEVLYDVGAAWKFLETRVWGLGCSSLLHCLAGSGA